MYLNPTLSARSLMSSLVSLSDHFSWSLGMALISVRGEDEEASTDGAAVT